MIQKLKPLVAITIVFKCYCSKDISEIESVLPDADIVCTATSSPTALFRGNLLKSCCHINAVGSFLPTTTELDPWLLANSTVIIDTEEALEVGDLNGLPQENLYGTLGKALLHIEKEPLEQYQKTRTIFKSVGTAVQDIYSAEAVYKLAEESNYPYETFTL